MLTVIDVEEWEEIKRLVHEIQHNHNWYSMRGGMLPYDWNTYMGGYLFDLERLVKRIDRRMKKASKGREAGAT
jgi:hypothetical protein